jgi:hypothetical protein
MPLDSLSSLIFLESIMPIIIHCLV